MLIFLAISTMLNHLNNVHYYSLQTNTQNVVRTETWECCSSQICMWTSITSPDRRLTAPYRFAAGKKFVGYSHAIGGFWTKHKRYLSIQIFFWAELILSQHRKKEFWTRFEKTSLFDFFIFFSVMKSRKNWLALFCLTLHIEANRLVQILTSMYLSNYFFSKASFFDRNSW